MSASKLVVKRSRKPPGEADRLRELLQAMGRSAGIDGVRIEIQHRGRLELSVIVTAPHEMREEELALTLTELVGKIMQDAFEKVVEDLRREKAGK